MKTSLLISAALIGLSAIGFAANETSEVSETTFDPGKFYGLIVNSNANIILTQGENNSVRIEGDKKELRSIHTEVENGALIINGDNNRSVNVYISVEDISLIEINGAAKIFASGSINSDILLLKVNGNGSMKLDIRTLSVGMIVKGNGKIIVSGSCGESYVKIHGNGKVYSDKLDSFNKKEERVAYNENTTEKKMILKLHQ